MCRKTPKSFSRILIITFISSFVAPLLLSCKLPGPEPDDSSTTIATKYQGSWVRVDREQYLYFGDTRAFMRGTRYSIWSEVGISSIGANEIVINDNGSVTGVAGYPVHISAHPSRADWLVMSASASGSIYFRRAAAKTASFSGTLLKDSALPGRNAGERPLGPATNISLVIQNILNSQDTRTVPVTNGSFTATGTTTGDTYQITNSGAGLSVPVTPQQRDENIGTISIPDRPQNFKAEYDFSPTPVDFGYFSAKFMVAGYEFKDSKGNISELYYDVALKIRNIGTAAAASGFTYALTPSADLEFKADSAPLSEVVTTPLAAGSAYEIMLHLRRPAPIDESKDVEVEGIDITIVCDGYTWTDRVELAFWRKLIYLEVFRFHKEPLLGTIASPNDDASGAWMNPAGDAVDWYYLPYRREGYLIAIYPLSETQGQTKYSIGYDGSILARTGEFDPLASDPNEPNDTEANAKLISYGSALLGIIGPGDIDYFRTATESYTPPDTEAPGPITNFTASPGDRSLTLSWTEPDPLPDDYWHLELEGCKAGGTMGDLWGNPHSGETSRTFTQLENGATYNFSARTVDYSGNKSEAVTVSGVPAWTKGGATSYTEKGSFGVLSLPPPLGKYNDPEDIAIDSEGNYFVADTGNNRIQIVGPTGNTVPWVSGGTSLVPGSFSKPAGIAIYGNFLYIADTGNNRVQIFDLSNRGAAPVIFGSAGTGNGQFSSTEWYKGPKNIACDGSHLYMSDTGNNRIQVFSLTGTFEKSWIGAFNKPYGITVSGGKVYVADYGSNRILWLPADTATGDVTSIAQKLTLKDGTGAAYNIAIPSDVILDGGKIYVGECALYTLLAFSIGSGDFVWSNFKVGAAYGFALDSAGKLVLTEASTTAPRICRYDTADGALLSSFGGSSLLTGDGELRNPYDVAVSPDGATVYVSDSANHRIQAFNANDNYSFIRKWGQGGGSGLSGTDDGEFRNPHRLTVGPDGKVYVADYENNRVQIFDSAGIFLGKWGISAPDPGSGYQSFNYPEDISISPDGTTAWVADYTNFRLQSFSTQTPYSYIGSILSDVDLSPNPAEYPGSRRRALAVAAEAGGTLLLGRDNSSPLLRVNATDGTPLWPAIILTNDIYGIMDVELDSDGNSYSSIHAKSSAREIWKFSPAGSRIATIKPSAGFSYLYGIGMTPLTATSHPGRIYAADYGNNVNLVYYFDPAP